MTNTITTLDTQAIIDNVKKNFDGTYTETKKQIEREITHSVWQKIVEFQEQPENILKLLEFIQSFYQYSTRNRALIYVQNPDAIALGSYTFFKKLGYPVRNGEHGIKIVAPNMVKTFTNAKGEEKLVKDATPDEKKKIKAGQLKTSQHIGGFNHVTVFDVTQTDLPKEDYPKIFPNAHHDYHVSGDFDLNAVGQGLAAIAKELKLSLVTNDEAFWQKYKGGAAKGFFAPNLNCIALNPRNTPTENVETLIHELTHATLHYHGMEENSILKKLNIKKHEELQDFEKELQAELTGYLVAKANGIDTSEDSIRYIASWTDNGRKIEESRLYEFFDEISKLAAYFIDTINKYRGKGEKRAIVNATEETDNNNEKQEKIETQSVKVIEQPKPKKTTKKAAPKKKTTTKAKKPAATEKKVTAKKKDTSKKPVNSDGVHVEFISLFQVVKIMINNKSPTNQGRQHLRLKIIFEN